MHKLLQIFIILFLIYSNAWADRICLKIINGQEVYTNLCNRESKKKSIKKSVNYRMTAMSQTSSSISREELENIVEENKSASLKFKGAVKKGKAVLDQQIKNKKAIDKVKEDYKAAYDRIMKKVGEDKSNILKNLEDYKKKQQEEKEQ